MRDLKDSMSLHVEYHKTHRTGITRTEATVQHVSWQTSKRLLNDRDKKEARSNDAEDSLANSASGNVTIPLFRLCMPV